MSFNDLEAQRSVSRTKNSGDNDSGNETIVELANSIKLLKREFSKIGSSRDNKLLRAYIDGDIIPTTLTNCKKIEEIDEIKNGLSERNKRLYYEQMKKEVHALINSFKKAKIDKPIFERSHTLRNVEEQNSYHNHYVSINPDGNGTTTPLLQKQKQVQIPQQLIDEEELSYQSIIQQERSQEISNIRNKVTEVNIIFKQLSNLVKEQETNIDTIDNNVTNLTNNLQISNKQLNKADEHQREKNRCSMIFLVVLIVIVLIVVLAILG